MHASSCLLHTHTYSHTHTHTHTPLLHLCCCLCRCCTWPLLRCCILCTAPTLALPALLHLRRSPSREQRRHGKDFIAAHYHTRPHGTVEARSAGTQKRHRMHAAALRRCHVKPVVSDVSSCPPQPRPVRWRCISPCRDLPPSPPCLLPKSQPCPPHHDTTMSVTPHWPSHTCKHAHRPSHTCTHAHRPSHTCTHVYHQSTEELCVDSLPQDMAGHVLIVGLPRSQESLLALLCPLRSRRLSAWRPVVLLDSSPPGSGGCWDAVAALAHVYYIQVGLVVMCCTLCWPDTCLCACLYYHLCLCPYSSHRPLCARSSIVCPVLLCWSLCCFCVGYCVVVLPSLLHSIPWSS
jgi:hypothetical protein